MATFQITNALITNAGLQAILSAGLTGPQVELTGFQIGSSSAAQGQTIAATDTAIPNIVYAGGTSQISYTISADGNSGNFLITLDETVGNFNCGIIGLLMGSGILFAEALLLQQEPKLASNPPATIGNVKMFSIGLIIQNIAACINLTILNSAYAALPEVEDELDLPNPSSATYSVYMVQNQTTVGRPGLAYRLNGAWYIDTIHLTPNQGNGVITVVPTLFGSSVGLNMAVYWDTVTSKFQPSDPSNPKTYPVGIATSTYEITTLGMIYHQTGDVWPGSVTPGSWYYVQTGGNAGKPGTTLTFLPYGLCISSNCMEVNFQSASDAYANYIPGTTSIVGTAPYGQPWYIPLATDTLNGLESSADKAAFDSYPVFQDTFDFVLANLSPEHTGSTVVNVVTPGDLGPEFDIGTQLPDKITILQGVFIGNGAPSNGFGSNGQYYIDRYTSNIWGPKTGGVWAAVPSYWGNNGALLIATTTTLTQYNTFVQIGGSTNTITIPTPFSTVGTIVIGTYFYFFNASSNPQIIQSAVGNIYATPEYPTGVTSITLQPGQSSFLVSDGQGWIQIATNAIATTTYAGVAREATLLEMSTGTTTGTSPAFVTPEGLGHSRNGIGPYYGTDSSSVPDIIQVNDLAPPITAYAAGELFLIKVANNNLTSSPVLQIDTFGTLLITRADGTPCKPNDIQAGADTLFANMVTSIQLVGVYTDFLPSTETIPFFSSTVWTVPLGIYLLKRVRAWGSGGGGGGSLGTGGGSSSSGGGGGGYAEAFGVAVEPGQLITVTIGAGGLGGIGLASGTSGGTTTFASTVPVGSTGGTGGSPNGTNIPGVGGTGFGGGINLTGAGGGFSFAVGIEPGNGQGGAAPFGGASPSFGLIYPLGGAGVFPGGGASGAAIATSGTGTGGDGADGFIIIEF